MKDELPAMCALPTTAGIGLRTPHYREFLRNAPAAGWVEVHSENFFDGGAPLRTLLQVRERVPVSLHGVGMGIASVEPLDPAHLESLCRLCDTIEPAAISEHLCWNAASGTYINDLLPFPYTTTALRHVSERVDRVQEKLGRRILLENLSSCLAFESSVMTEAEFLAELTERTGCGILFDVENLHVNVRNLGVDAKRFIEALPAESVREYHLAGYSIRDGCLIDTHDHAVYDEVWELFEYVIEKIGPRPTLIEWDSAIPSLPVLVEEAEKARKRLEASCRR